MILPTGREIIASGGDGGKYGSHSYYGYGKSVYSECTGETYYDGIHTWRPWRVSGWGGQASQFGHGGSRKGRRAGHGAGGAAVSHYYYYYDNEYYNKGGDGIVMIRWGEEDDSSGTNVSSVKFSKTLTPDFINEFEHYEKTL